MDKQLVELSLIERIRLARLAGEMADVCVEESTALEAFYVLEAFYRNLARKLDPEGDWS